MKLLDVGSRGLVLAGALAWVGCKKGSSSEHSVNAAPAAIAIQWNTNANAYRAQMGATLAFACPPGGSPSTVWGSDTYTSDSSICGAAAHSGRIQAASGGVVQIQIAPGLPSYSGTIRGGVATLNYGSYPASFTIVGGPAPGLIAVPVPAVAVNAQGVNIGGVQIQVGGANGGSNPWSENARARRGQNGTSFVHQCPPGGSFGSVWGSGPYTDDSSICTAAVHAGRIQQAAGGAVTVFVHPGRARYPGSAANGVTSSSFASYPGSFAFDAVLAPEAAAPGGAEALSWTQNASQFRGQNATTHLVWCPPNGSASSVWGSNPFTDDSSICTAGVHAGKIQLASGGSFRIRIGPGLPRYRGSARNGVTSSNFGSFPGSYIVVP